VVLVPGDAGLAIGRVERVTAPLNEGRVAQPPPHWKTLVHARGAQQVDRAQGRR
jgi:hypothetical protein